MGKEAKNVDLPELSLAGFVIEADVAERAARAANSASVEAFLPSLVPAALRLARAPISRFPVGAVGLGASGRVFLGVNLEFPGLPLNHSVHAEQFLVAVAAAAGEHALRSIAVSHVPCGHCRQFLQEIRGAAEIQVLVTADGDAAAFRPLGSLLPRPFGPQDLLVEDVPYLLEPHDNPLGVLPDEPGLAAPCNGAAPGVYARLKEAAEKAARAAHAPYSGCAAGFAVADAAGRVHAGAYAESAAYNPSLGPVQAAMVAMAAAGGATEEVVAAALVEVAPAAPAAAVSHESTASIFLAAVAPRAHLAVYRYVLTDVA